MIRLLFCFLLLPFSWQLAAGGGGSVSEKNTQNLLSKFEINSLPNDLVDLIQVHIADLNGKKEKYTEKKFLKITFRSTQKLFLNNFKPYTVFSELAIGSFDCVTGSALFAIILTTLDITFEIHELENHVYILANSTKGRALFEATDPYFGLVFGVKNIEQRRQTYKENVGDAAIPRSNAILVNKHPTIENSISLHQLAGLHAYNQAAVAFNSGDFAKCHALLLLAEHFYPCERVAGLMQIVVQNLPLEISMR